MMSAVERCLLFFFFQAEDGIRDIGVTGVQTCALPIYVLQKGNDIVYKDIFYKSEMVLGEEREGIKISFVTDTTPINELVPFIENSDLLVCEGTYGNDKDIDKAVKNKHMTFSQAAMLAKDGKVKELILTHFSTAMDNPEEFIHFAKDIFKDTYIAEDRMLKNLKFN